MEIRGYFQSEKYWLHCKDEVLRYLTPKGLVERDAVAIHHRRGDYVSNPNYQQLGMGYYMCAYGWFFSGKKIEGYSDSWEYLDVHYNAHSMQRRAGTEIDDLRAIASCRYHIVSNSTFSWWAAYLSPFAKKCVRPQFVFDGPLKKNEEQDFWPKHWIAWPNFFSQAAGDVTFIIPVMVEHAHRLENITEVVAWIKKHFDTRIIIGEVNGDATKHLADGGAVRHIRYNMPKFHRTKVLNMLTATAGTPYVFNWDADVVCSPWQVFNAIERLRAGVDIVYPFKDVFANIPREHWVPFLAQKDVGVFGGRLWPWMASNYKSVGGAVGYSRKSFLFAGGENEGFISYGPEDQERYLRFEKLGLSIEKIPGTIFHMAHWRGPDSGERHPDAANNIALFNLEKKMSSSEMAAYVEGPLWGSADVAAISDSLLKIGLIVIATGKYDRFIEPLIESAKKWFMGGFETTYYIMTDGVQNNADASRVYIPIQHEPWPGPTLHRYRNIIANKALFAGMDYLFYCDVDMRFEAPVGREILGEGLTAVMHPGYYSSGTGAWCKNQRSTAYTVKPLRYYAGGFQGGKADVYLHACEVMANNIAVDDANGVVAEWHDESHWNKLLAETTKLTVLTPSYCMVEQQDLREKWKISHLQPKLIALYKNHSELR